jgi:hypothetical protein
LTLQRVLGLNQRMTTAAFISLSQAHPHLAAFAAAPAGPMETMMRVSGYVFALIAAAVIVAAIEALNDR